MTPDVATVITSENPCSRKYAVVVCVLNHTQDLGVKLHASKKHSQLLLNSLDAPFKLQFFVVA